MQGEERGSQEAPQGKEELRHHYTLKRFKDGAWRQASYKLLVVRKRLRRGSRCYGYATNTDIGLKRVYKEYRRRFGIESSYRLMNQSSARTSIKDAVKRLLLVAVSLLLTNLWTYLKWNHTSAVRRGRHGRTVEEELLPYATLLLILLNITQDTYGTIRVIPPNNRSLDKGGDSLCTDYI